MNTFQAALKIQRAWREIKNYECPCCGHYWCLGRIRGSVYCLDPYLNIEW